MTHDQPLRRVHIDRIVLRGRTLAPGDELVLRSSLRRTLRHPDGPSHGVVAHPAPGGVDARVRLSAPGDGVSELGTAVAAAVRRSVEAAVTRRSTVTVRDRDGGER